MAKVDLELTTDLRKATKNISKFSKSSASSLESLKGSFGTLAKLAGVVAGAFAFKKVVESAAKQEQAVRSLNTALAITGDFTEETSKHFQEFASELQRNSTVGDEVSLSLVGLAKSMGATNDQTEQVIQAAVDLSAVTGESLETSVRNLTKTLGGMKGELGETQPEIRSLTKEQLMQGEALDILAKKYKGSAKELTKTFGGALSQTKNSFGDLLEEIGFLITENPVIVKAINLMSKGFNKLGDIIKENKESIIDFAVDGMGGAIKGLAFLIDSIGDVIAIFRNLDAIVDTITLAITDMVVFAVEGSDQIVKAFKGIVNLGLKPLLSGFEKAAKALNTIGIVSDESLGKLQRSLKDIALDSSTSGLEAMKDDVMAFRDAVEEGLVESTDRLLETKDGFSKAAETVAQFADELVSLKDVSKDTNKTLQKLSDTNKQLKKDTEVPFAERKFGKIGGKEVTGAGILTGAGAFAGGLGKGAAGLSELFAGGAAGVANLALPGLGAVVGPLTQLLAQGPEVAKKTVEAFIDQIPVLIDAITEALPVVVETLAENMDKVVIALVKGMPKVAAAMAVTVPIALVKGIAKAIQKHIPIPLTKTFSDAGKMFTDAFKGILEALKKIFTSIYIKLPKKIFDGVKKAFEKIVKVLSTLFTEIFQSLKGAFKTFFLDLPKKLIEALVNGIKEAFKQVGNIGGDIAKGVGGVLGGLGRIQAGISTGGLSEVGKVLGFAQGGEVPPGFPNDTFPAPRLTSGENVIDRSTNEKLNEFLDSGTSTNVILQVGEKQLADVLLNLNRQGFRTA